MIRFYFILFGFAFTIQSILLIFDIKVIGRHNTYPTMSNKIGYLYIGIIFFILGYFFKNKNKSIEFSICPKCKETYTYKDLKDGKCPHCKNIDTIDIEKYYKDKKDKINDETNTN